jgi:hypoxia-inducible factor (prolyl hydroxylase)
VQPLFDRLLLFFADYRVPHEVLAAHADRLAITLWYFDKAEYTRARERGEAADMTDQSEAKSIEEEIAKFEARYGAGAMRHAESKVNTP